MSSCHCSNTNNIVITCKTCNQCFCKTCFIDIIQTSFLFEKCVYCDKTENHSLIHCFYCNEELTEEYILENTNELVKSEYIKSKLTLENKQKKKIIIQIKPKPIIEKTYMCPVCMDDCFESNKVTCIKCENECCKTCFQRFILENSELSPKCMHDTCEKKITIQNIIMSVDKLWFDTIYKSYRSDLLMKIEELKLNETMESAKVYQEAFYVLLNSTYSYEIIENATVCRDVYGKGWEGFDFAKNEARPLSAYKGFQFACSNIGCRGMVSDSNCNLCGSQICIECHEIIKLNHKCNKDTVESMQAIFKEAKPCPKCSALISKIEGCDQMFCTQCHTTYSWNTGQLVTGFVHNPHYFAWLDEQKKLIPVRMNMECQEFISYQRLLGIFHNYQLDKKNPPLSPMISLFDKLPSIEHYRMAFKGLHANILHVRATSGNHANVVEVDNHELRVKLLCDDINEEEMKIILFKKDYDFHRYISYFNIYLLVFQVTGILFDNLWAYHFDNKKCADKSILKINSFDYIHSIYFQIQKILEYGNECLDYNNKCYGEDPLFVKFNRYPFQ